MPVSTFNQSHENNPIREQTGSSSNVRINGVIGIGPVTTVSELLASYPKDHPSYRPMPAGRKPPADSKALDVKEWIVNPTIEELHTYCVNLFGAEGKKDQEANKSQKPVFGPERPPA